MDSLFRKVYLFENIIYVYLEKKTIFWIYFELLHPFLIVYPETK